MKPKFLPGTVVVIDISKTHALVGRVILVNGAWVYYLVGLVSAFPEHELSEVEK